MHLLQAGLTLSRSKISSQYTKLLMQRFQRDNDINIGSVKIYTFKNLNFFFSKRICSSHFLAISTLLIFGWDVEMIFIIPFKAAATTSKAFFPECGHYDLRMNYVSRKNYKSRMN